MDHVIERLSQFAEVKRPASWYEERREAIAAARVAGYSYGVIGAVLGITRQAVHASQNARGKQ